MFILPFAEPRKIHRNKRWTRAGATRQNRGMKVPFTRKSLLDWAGEQVVSQAERMVEDGLVRKAEYAAPRVVGSVLWNNREMKTGLRILSGGLVESECPCYVSREKGLVCSHAIAVALVLVKRATDPLRDTRYRAERRRAERLADIEDGKYIRRAAPDTAGAVPAKVRLTLDAGWREPGRRGDFPVACDLLAPGRALPAGEAPRDTPFAFDKHDGNLLFVLEDICEGPAQSRLNLQAADFINILRLHVGRSLPCADGTEVQVGDTPMTTHLQMDLDRENGELLLNAHTELPFLKTGEFPLYVVAGRDGWVYGAGHFWPLQNVLPVPYQGMYAETRIVRRPAVLRFLQQELPVLSREMRVESDLSLDLFTLDPADPSFRLVVRGSPASLSAELYAVYGDLDLVAGRPDVRGDFAQPDPGDLLRYTVRNPGREKQALEDLRATGFGGESGDALTPIVGKRNVMNFFGRDLPPLRRRGWRIEIEGRARPFLEGLDFVTPVVRIGETADAGWFEVGFGFEERGGASLSAADIQLALRKGESFVTHGGRTLLIDADAVESMNGIFSDCAGEGAGRSGFFRMDGIHAAFVKSSLDALDGVDVEDTPAWRRQADRCNRTLRIQPVPLSGGLEKILRPYQKEGVNWMRFLEENGFGGLLADEMGLGKTIQALVWLSLRRCRDEARGKPALVVCPTSLVQNWAEEAARFTPDLRVLLLSGRERHERWEDVPQRDLAVTSYALLRRDLAQYEHLNFSAVILDEAQHIKNRSSQNALAAKQLKARHRFVLTGTPMENSVSDLWSIMDFLMPGYLGVHDTFRLRYEQPIARDGGEGEKAQVRLRRKLQPFLMRRLKRDVARDLPPKIERIAGCDLTADQQAVYRELLNASRSRIRGLVSQKGFQRCRMEILAVLMRLRQVCCHLDLLKLPGLEAEQPSGKMDHFFELLDEALDGGHRVLVFSQFVAMLQILRRELDRRELAYCYLDGATRERLKVVHRFNTERSVPVFLISLKAGGTGLNLTGADMVIHFDPWWNPAVENQATDRAYRIGQRRTVYSVKLIARDTVEERVLALQRRKQDVIRATIESDDAPAQQWNWEDVRELLEM